MAGTESVRQVGMERDLDEFDTLFTASGWRRDRTFPVGAGQFGLELRPG